MPAKRVVEVDEPADVRPGIARGLAGLEVDLLVFDRLPEALDQYIVAPAPLAVHADGDLVCLQELDEFGSRKLTPLIGAEPPRESRRLVGLNDHAAKRD